MPCHSWCRLPEANLLAVCHAWLALRSGSGAARKHMRAYCLLQIAKLCVCDALPCSLNRAVVRFNGYLLLHADLQRSARHTFLTHAT